MGLEEIEYSNISINGIKSESTPIQRKSVDLTDYQNRSSIPTSTDPIDITSDNEDVTEELDSIVTLNPELNIAKKETGEINPVNLAHIMFSPKKQQRKQMQQVVQPEEGPPIDNENSPTPTILNPWTPYTLTLYFQLLVNIILWGIFIYFLISTILTIKADINRKIELHTLNILDQISKCSKMYLLNKCNSQNRPPAINKECEYLEKCQNQDPNMLGRSKITIEVITEILNTFSDQIHYKTIIIFMVFLTTCILLTSINLRNFHNGTNVFKKIKYD